jgi:hypothetical protein
MLLYNPKEKNMSRIPVPHVVNLTTNDPAVEFRSPLEVTFPEKTTNENRSCSVNRHTLYTSTHATLP